MNSRMDAHAHHADLGHEHVTPLSVYFGIFGALMVLTAVTVAVAWVNLGSLNILVALGVARVQGQPGRAVLHAPQVQLEADLDRGRRRVVLDDDPVRHHMADYLTRGWMPSPTILH